ncbi:hypothetical protein Cfor_06768 [Coptotermes formosanus]|uniref:Gustatory receptor n=1 Tax=Coptotermes formosanus TaxID=36987 RepID=A0A6L2PII2_COPFO|nr:hypothetical protein Cfor_06768 [Coptotermes formosanus]
MESEMPCDQKCDQPKPIRWRPLDEPAMHKNKVTLVIPAAEEVTAADLFDELKPIFYSMKIFGLFPLKKQSPGESTVRCKISLAYSVTFYVAMSVYSYHVCMERMQFIRHSEGSFDELMYSVIHFFYVIPHFYFIPCHWKEVIKVGNYFSHWSEFQKQYLSATGTHLYLRQDRWAKISVVLTPILALLSVVTEYFLSSANQKYWELGFYWYILTVIFLHVVWWWFVCSSLRGAMLGISENFFKIYNLFVHERLATLVAQYTDLWVSLSRLTRETGVFMCYTYGHMCVLSFSVVTLSLYGTLSSVHDGVYMRHLVLAMSVCFIGGIMYVISNVAHHAAIEVGPEFSEKLSHLSSADKQVRRELKLFTLATTTNSSEINLGGYVRIDRGFLLRFICTMVTYLVVLLQFRLGLLSISTSNITTVTTAVL